MTDEKIPSWVFLLTVVNPIITLAATITSFWTVYDSFRVHGVWTAFVTFLFLAICYKFGVSPMFAIAVSILHFHFHAVGLWLPIVAYVLATVTLVLNIKLRKIKQNMMISEEFDD